MVLVVKNLPANARDLRNLGWIPELGRSLGAGHSNPLQYSCLENSTNRKAWWATVYRIAKSFTQLSKLACMVTHALSFKFVSLDTMV